MSSAARTDRRHFLRTSSALLALPWLESLAGAVEAAPPRRLVSICTNFGLYGPSFFPEQAGRDYQPSEYLRVLGDLRSQFTVFSGIAHPEIGGDHASEACFLTSAKHPTAGGFRNSVSLDQLAAEHIGEDTRFPTLAAAVRQGEHYADSVAVSRSGVLLPAEASAEKLYRRLFVAGTAEEKASTMRRIAAGGSVLDLLRADTTFVNERVATEYGLPNVRGAQFRPVKLADPNRFGLFGKGAVLMVTSHATTTSPVLRGKWILENILGSPPPAPPPTA